MTPSRGRWTGNNDEIPFAERTIPIRILSLQKSSAIFLPLIFIFFSLVTIGLSVLFPQFLVNRSKDLEVANDISLLGHFPYPEVSNENLVSLYPGFKVHKDTYDALIAMRKAASLEGVQLVFLSGFRSIDLQEEIFYENKSIRNQIAIERAKVSAPPGYSEHSTGYAVDFGDRNMRETDFEVSFETTPAFRWLKKNAAKYHFVLSFPRNNSQGVSYEPWHWRFEGTVEALKKFELSNRLRIRSEKSN